MRIGWKRNLCSVFYSVYLVFLGAWLVLSPPQKTYQPDTFFIPKKPFETKLPATPIFRSRNEKLTSIHGLHKRGSRVTNYS
jgi:hypothetical protein